MNTMVLKIGGSILGKLPASFFETIVQLKAKKICDPIIVHGGGPEINAALKQMEIETKFVNGLRVTTQEVLNVAEMVMSGSVNKKIVTNIQKQGGFGFGLSGVDGELLEAQPVDHSGELGFVGEVANVNTIWIEAVMQEGAIPVISPIGVDATGQQYNINGDMAAAGVAEAMGGKLALISDIPGVMETIEEQKIIHATLTSEQIEQKIDSGVIYGGMIPKVRSALKSLEGGVAEAVILNGFAPNDLKDYVEGKNAGTKVMLEKEGTYV